MLSLVPEMGHYSTGWTETSMKKKGKKHLGKSSGTTERPKTDQLIAKAQSYCWNDGYVTFCLKLVVTNRSILTLLRAMVDFELGFVCYAKEPLSLEALIFSREFEPRLIVD